MLLHVRVVYTDSVYPSLYREVDVSLKRLSVMLEFHYLRFLQSLRYNHPMKRTKMRMFLLIAEVLAEVRAEVRAEVHAEVLAGSSTRSAESA